METEYMALSNAARELITHLTFFTLFTLELGATILYTDNEAAESVVKHEPDYQRSKDIDIWHHFVLDHYEKGTFGVAHLPTTNSGYINKGKVLGKFACPEAGAGANINFLHPCVNKMRKHR